MRATLRSLDSVDGCLGAQKIQLDVRYKLTSWKAAREDPGLAEI